MQVYVDSSIPEGGGVIWDAALVFLHFLYKPKHGFSDYLDSPAKDFTVLDLGAGTGILGLALAQKYPTTASILMSEMSPGCRALMHKSIMHNGLEGRVREVELWWGREEARGFRDTVMGGKHPELVVGSDLIYSKKLFRPLVETIEEMCGEGTRCLMASTDHGNMHEFLQMVEESPKIKYKIVENEWLDEVF